MKTSFESELPNWYTSNNEPKTVSGRNKGLVLMLDAHSDQLSAGSVDRNFRGFTAVVGSRGSFPLMNKDGLPIRPGKNACITITFLSRMN